MTRSCAARYLPKAGSTDSGGSRRRKPLTPRWEIPASVAAYGTSGVSSSSGERTLVYVLLLFAQIASAFAISSDLVRVCGLCFAFGFRLVDSVVAGPPVAALSGLDPPPPLSRMTAKTTATRSAATTPIKARRRLGPPASGFVAIEDARSSRRRVASVGAAGGP